MAVVVTVVQEPFTRNHNFPVHLINFNESGQQKGSQSASFPFKR